jgi:hypothetical protein
VQSVHVDSALSNDASSNGSRWPSSPARSTGTGAASRSAAESRQATSDGSTAVTRFTAPG